MTIIKPKLITAFKATVDGRKVLKPIDGSRFTGHIDFSDKPRKVQIEFDAPVSWIDCTWQSKGFTGKISIKGLGLDVPDITALIPDQEKHTYRFNISKPVQGTVIFESTAGKNSFEFFNISGFTEDK